MERQGKNEGTGDDPQDQNTGYVKIYLLKYTEVRDLGARVTTFHNSTVYVLRYALKP